MQRCLFEEYYFINASICLTLRVTKNVKRCQGLNTCRSYVVDRFSVGVWRQTSREMEQRKKERMNENSHLYITVIERAVIKWPFKFLVQLFLFVYKMIKVRLYHINSFNSIIQCLPI